MSSAGRVQVHLTDGQIALSATRKLHNSRAAQSVPRNDRQILTREWTRMRESSNGGKGVLKIMTWNVSFEWPKCSEILSEQYTDVGAVFSPYVITVIYVAPNVEELDFLRSRSFPIKVTCYPHILIMFLRLNLATSDCLKASQREGMLMDELLRYNADIICLQVIHSPPENLAIQQSHSGSRPIREASATAPRCFLYGTVCGRTGQTSWLHGRISRRVV